MQMIILPAVPRLLLLVFFPALARGRAVDNEAEIKNIITSGRWEPEFNPKHLDYAIELAAGLAAAFVEIEIDFNSYPDPSKLPKVSIDDQKPQAYGPPGPITHKANLQGSEFETRRRTVKVHVSDYKGASKATYVLRIESAPDFATILKPVDLAVFDDQGRVINLIPDFNTEALEREYVAHFKPDVRRTNVSLSCNRHVYAEIVFSGTNKSNRGLESTWVPLAAQASETIVRAACAYGGHRHTLGLRLEEVAQLAGVELQLLVVGGGASVMKTQDDMFVVTCERSPVELVPMFTNTRLPLRLEVVGGGSYTSGSGIRTPPLDAPVGQVRKARFVMSDADGQMRIWKVMIKRHVLPTPEEIRAGRASRLSRSYILGSSALGFSVFCIFAVGFVSVAASLSGIGSPLGTSSSLRSLVLLLQCVTFNNIVSEETCVLNDFTDALQPLGIIPPLSKLREGGTALYSQAPWQACVSLRRCGIFLAAVAFAQVIAIVAHYCRGGARHTFPHGLVFGTWGLHALPYVAYPMSYAAGVLLASEATSSQWTVDVGNTFTPPTWRTVARTTLTVVISIAVASLLRVVAALRREVVMWLAADWGDGDVSAADRVAMTFGASVEHGHFCDTLCDQLTSRPRDRCFCAGALLDLQWAATIADIREVDVQVLQPPEGLEFEAELDSVRKGMPAFARKAPVEEDPASPISRSVRTSRTVVVEVVSTLSPMSFANCIYSFSGRFVEIEWLVALLSSEALLRLHHEVVPQMHAWGTPTSVDVGQLQGPITNGRLSFCFDGMRWPIYPPLEIALRVALGFLSAMAAVSPSSRPAAYSTQGALMFCFFILSLYHAPYAGLTENALQLLWCLGMAFSAMVYLGHVCGVFVSDDVACLIFFVVGGTGIPLAVSAGLRTVGLACSASCPLTLSNEEADILEECNVDLVLRGPKDSWLLMVPAICSLPVVDIFVYALPDASGQHAKTHAAEKFVGSRPRLEFPVLDYIAIKDKLEPPLVILSGPGVLRGSMHVAETIYSDEDPQLVTLDFVHRCLGGGGSGADVLAEILDVIRARSRVGQILSIGVVVLPVATAVTAGETSSDDETHALIPPLRAAWRSGSAE